MKGPTSLDEKYPCEHRNEFNIPTFKSMGISNEEKDIFYMCGNSLGLMPKSTPLAISRELDAWKDRAVESHFRHPSVSKGLTSWVDIDLPITPLLAPLLGAEDKEVAVMNTLTSNLNSLLVSFYRPRGKKFKILFEQGAFPSDYYAFYNQCKIHDIDPQEGLIQIKPRKGEYTLRTEDILDTIKKNEESLALVCLPGIQYYTGQLFDIKRITAYAHSFEGINVGWDLAHAVGNVPLSLHEWQVDFACWCSYKYLNSGPGCIGGIFVHSAHSKVSPSNEYLSRLAGWWGNNRERRFDMVEYFEPIAGAQGFRQSNPSVIDVVAVRSSLDIFKMAGGIGKLRNRSLLLTSYLQDLLQSMDEYFIDEHLFRASGRSLGFTIITPLKAEERGAQLSLLILSDNINPDEKISSVFKTIHKLGVIADERKPNVLRLAPTPLYNTFCDIYNTVDILRQAMNV